MSSQSQVYKTTRILKIFLAIFSIILSASGCSSSPVEDSTIPVHVDETREAGTPVTDLLYAPFEEVWIASLKTIQDYPLATSNKMSGIIETKWIRPNSTSLAYKLYGKRDRNPPSQKYKLRISILKGRSKGKEAAKIAILKTEMQKKTLQPWEEVGTNGIEEHLIRYRIRRELKLAFIIQKKLKAEEGDN